MIRRCTPAFVFAVFAAVLGGCRSMATEAIPRYPRMPIDASLATIDDRADAVRDVTGKGTLTLTQPDGDSVRLDVVYVLAPPDRARVRAWKFSRAVFDLTRRGDDVWLYLPRGDERADELTASAQQFGAALGDWLAFFAGEFDASEATLDGDHLLVRRPINNGLTLRATIDRATLTPRQYEAIDAAGEVRFSLRLERYRELDGTVWPQVFEARSAAGTVRLDASDLQTDVAPAAAFEPPRRAEHLSNPEPR